MSLGTAMVVEGWHGASVLVAVGMSSATYAAPSDEASAVEAIDDLIAWVNDPARPWSPPSATWSAEGDGAGRLAFRIAGITSATADATWQARCAIAVGVGAVVGTSRGTCAATIGTVGWDRTDTETGQRARSGGWRAAHRMLSLGRPSCELAMDLREAWGFNESVRLAALPRRMDVWDEGSRAWRRVKVGAVDMTPQGDSPGRIVGTVELFEEA